MKTIGWWGALGAFTLALAGCSKGDLAGGDVAFRAAGPAAAEAGLADPAVLPRRSPALGSFATLPDRGAFAQPDALRHVRREGAYAWHPVQLSEEHAINAIGSGELVLPAPDGQVLRLSYGHHVEHADGNWSWFGRDRQGRDAIITFGEKAVFGSIPNGDEEPLRLIVAGGRSWMLETDRRALAHVDNDLTRPKHPDFLLPPETPVVDEGRVAAAAAAMEASTGTSAPVIDLVLGYTAGFASMLGGDSQARTRLTYMVDLTNQAFKTSQVNAQVRLVHAMLVDYADNTANDNTLTELSGYKSGSGWISVPAALQPLRDAREKYGADMVSLVRRFNQSTNGGCGIAWLIGGSRSTYEVADHPFAYSVVSDSGGNLYPDGGYVCRDETLAHELGHNLGSQHDRTTATDNGTLKYGAFDYSFGMKSGAGASNFYTIMAYGDSGQYKNRVFSNPRISICGEYPSNFACGVENTADNVRSLNQTLAIAAGFRATVVPMNAKAVRNDLNGDRKADIVWRNAANELQAHWIMSGPARAAVAYKAVSSIYRIIETGDFDGDGRADLLWTNNTNDLLWIWRSRGDGQYDVHFVDGYPPGWTVEGVTDLNGDGKSDLVWRNSSLGLFDYWLMNGATRVASGVKQAVSPIYRIIGTGDFDGDGRGDLLWTNNTNDLLWTWRSRGDGQFDVNLVDGYPQGWSVKGVADLNADGKADIVWQNPGRELMAYWLMNGHVRIGSADRSVGSAYRIVTTGDYDGDGRGDLLWTNNSNDLLWIWRSRSDGGFDIQFVDGYPSGWAVVGAGL
ncbi:reprolysin-like metallopeptidase [Lysobacter korlensis]|uniref:Reprolysin-like metallopeptidase n=1 Tax=Lysobacter korlensis TaxID=553636 RepID=A0ABV6RIT2_9GAMM